MKSYKKLVAAILASVIGLFTTNQALAKITDENQLKIKQLTEITNALRTSGVQIFVTRCAEQGWASPKLFSAWYIARLPDDPDGLKQVEEAKSNLGLELARQLSVIAKTVRETKEIHTLEQATDTLFEAAKWIGTELGYGNLFLQDRAYDIASVAAVKFMADLSYPMDKAEAAMKRFDWTWGDPAKRRIVLFEESGGTHFKPENAPITDDGLELEWRTGVSKAIDSQELARQPDLAIFVLGDFRADESFAVPETTWLQKGHHRIGQNSFASMNLRNLESLREFRVRYGKFPTKPVNYSKGEGESDVVAAFWELSWRDPLKVSGAARIYEQYINGSLADEGWQNLRASSKVSPPAE